MFLAFTLGLQSSWKLTVNEPRSLCCGWSFLSPLFLYHLRSAPSVPFGKGEAPSNKFAANGKTTFTVSRLVLMLLPADCSHCHC